MAASVPNSPADDTNHGLVHLEAWNVQCLGVCATNTVIYDFFPVYHLKRCKLKNSANVRALRCISHSRPHRGVKCSFAGRLLQHFRKYLLFVFNYGDLKDSAPSNIMTIISIKTHNNYPLMTVSVFHLPLRIER